VIHRDLKPANVLVGSFGETVVVDWGLAKDLLRAGGFEEREDSAGGRGSDQDSGTPHATPDALTVVGTVLGTPSYMAPEQARGEALDERADVYALGAILYTVLAGSPPYVGPSSTAVLAEVLKGPPAPLEERQAGLPEDLLAIVRKAMSVDRDHRYRTAGELSEDLRRYQTGQLVGAHRYGAGELVRRWIKKHRGAVAVAAAAAIALTIGGTLAIRRIQNERDVAQARNDDLVLSQARATVEIDPTEAVAWLKHYSLAGPKWSAVRMIAADARSRGIARVVLPGHESEVREMAFSPDGRRLASVGNDGALRLWDTQTGAGQMLFRSDWHNDSVDFSPDGRRIALGYGLSENGGNRVGVWDLRTGRMERVAREASDVSLVRFSADGHDLLLFGDSIARWDLERSAFRYVSSKLVSWKDREIALSPDRQGAVTRDQTGQVLSWDLETGGHVVLASAQKQTNPSGGLAYWGSDVAFGRGAEVRIAAHHGASAHTLTGQEAAVLSLAASRDGRWLASGGDDWIVRLWSREGGPPRLLRGHTDAVHFLAFSPDGRTLVSMSRGSDHRLLLWDVATGRKRALSWSSRVFLTFGGVPVFSPDAAMLATSDLSIELWGARRSDTEELEVPAEAATHDARIAFSPSGHWLAAGADDRPLRVWDLSQRTSRVLASRNDWVLAFSPDDKHLAAAGDAIVRVWSLPDLTVREFRGHTEGVDSLAFSPDSSELASASRDRTVRLWNLGTGESRTLRGHESWLTRVTYSPDGRLVATATNPMKFDSGEKPDKDVHIWDRMTGSLRLLKGHTDTVSWVDFSPDGRFLASASMDRTVRIWNLAHGISRVLEGHGDVVFKARFAPLGDRVVSTANDGTTRVFDLATGSSRVYPGIGRGSWGLSLSADGRTLALEDWLWDVASGEGRRLEPDDWVGPTVFSPRGGLVAARTALGGVRLWRDDLPADPAALRHWLEGATNRTVDIASSGRLR
jgi:WD40 repeat protein